MKHTYTKIGDEWQIEKGEITPEDEATELHRQTREVAAANPGFLVCGASYQKDDEDEKIVTQVLHQL